MFNVKHTEHIIVNLNHESMAATELGAKRFSMVTVKAKQNKKYTKAQHNLDDTNVLHENIQATECEMWTIKMRLIYEFNLSLSPSLAFSLSLIHSLFSRSTLDENKIKINKASDVEASAYVHCLCVCFVAYLHRTNMYTPHSAFPG